MSKRYWKIQRDLALSLCAAPVTFLTVPAVLSAAEPPAATQAADLTKDQIEAIIKQAGENPPAWWDTTQMTVPDGMDLSWNNKTATDDKHAIRLYLFDFIWPNPDRWPEGVKLVQYSLTQAGTDANAKGNATNFLAIMYTELLQDYARGAFWTRKLGGGMNIRLAHCYFKLGSKSMAIETLNKINEAGNKDPGLIKIWAEVGDLPKALSLVDGLAKTNPGGAYLSAGEACRLAGDNAQAISFYQKVLALNIPNGENLFRPRAAASLEAIKLYDSLDLQKIADGTFTSECVGYSGPVKIEVVVKSHHIDSVKVTEHHEKRFFSSIVDTTGQIVLKQTVKGIDTTSGATITSEAIINASAKALSSAK